MSEPVSVPDLKDTGTDVSDTPSSGSQQSRCRGRLPLLRMAPKVKAVAAERRR